MLLAEKEAVRPCSMQTVTESVPQGYDVCVWWCFARDGWLRRLGLSSATLTSAHVARGRAQGGECIFARRRASSEPTQVDGSLSTNESARKVLV